MIRVFILFQSMTIVTNKRESTKTNTYKLNDIFNSKNIQITVKLNFTK